MIPNVSGIASKVHQFAHFGHLVFVAIVPSCEMDDAEFT